MTYSNVSKSPSEIAWLNELFIAIDKKDVEAFVSFLAQDSTFRFGNLPAVEGKKNIGEFVSGFFASIDSLNHRIVAAWQLPVGAFCHGLVSYTRHDKSVLAVPFSNLFATNADSIREYLIFADTSQLYV